MNEEFFQLLSLSLNQDFLFKIALIVLLLLYTLFALILANQIRTLSRIIDQVSFSPIFATFAHVHAILSILLLFGIVLFL